MITIVEHANNALTSPSFCIVRLIITNVLNIISTFEVVNGFEQVIKGVPANERGDDIQNMFNYVNVRQIIDILFISKNQHAVNFWEIKM